MLTAFLLIVIVALALCWYDEWYTNKVRRIMRGEE